jgi:hypothetical protein
LEIGVPMEDKDISMQDVFEGIRDNLLKPMSQEITRHVEEQNQLLFEKISDFTSDIENTQNILKRLQKKIRLLFYFGLITLVSLIIIAIFFK